MPRRLPVNVIAAQKHREAEYPIEWWVCVLFFPFPRWVGQSDILGMELKDGESCGMAKKLVRWEVFVIRSDAMQPASLGN